MPLSKLWMLAYRDLGRNRRRSLLSILAVGLGLALLVVMNGTIAGVLDESLQNSIRLRTGHLQLRAPSYDEEQLSLGWPDLLDAPEEHAARAAALPEVRAAAPVLWAGAILASGDESASMQLYGIDVASPIYEPIRSTIVAGEYLSADDRGGVLIGQRLADSLRVEVGRKISLAIVDSQGGVDEGTFTVRGIFATGIPSYDDSAAFMPLGRAQAFTGAGPRASAVMVMLHRQDDADAVAAALGAPGVAALTWEDLNRSFIEAVGTGMGFYLILDLIVILIVAVIIANTLLMSVFERVREMGILAAIGMRGRQLLQLFVLQAAGLGLAGVALGLAIGLAGVAYLATVGLQIGGSASSVGRTVALSTTMHATFVPATFAWLSLATLAITLLASLYPAWYAARLEPVDALRG